jgi:hypothetical protein
MWTHNQIFFKTKDHTFIELFKDTRNKFHVHGFLKMLFHENICNIKILMNTHPAFNKMRDMSTI